MVLLYSQQTKETNGTSVQSTNTCNKWNCLGLPGKRSRASSYDFVSRVLAGLPCEEENLCVYVLVLGCTVWQFTALASHLSTLDLDRSLINQSYLDKLLSSCPTRPVIGLSKAM